MIEGVGSVDESAITGESAPVIREAGRRPLRRHRRHEAALRPARDRGHPGARQVVPRPDDRAWSRAPSAARRRTRSRSNILLAGLTITFLAAVVTLRPFARLRRHRSLADALVALLVALIPTTIGALLSAIGIAGMDRLVQRNVLAMSGRAVEASGDVDVLLLDKTGTITLGNRQAAEFLPVDGRRASASWPRRRSSPRSPTRRRRAARSSCSPRSTSGSASASSPRTRPFVPFTASDADERRRPDGTPAPQGRRRRGQALHRRARRPRARRGRRRLDRQSPARAARRSSSPGTTARSASSTSRTSSRAACASASTSSAGWASAR